MNDGKSKRFKGWTGCPVGMRRCRKLGNFEVDKITALEDSVDVLCHYGVIHMEFSWETDKMLEVIE